MLTNLAVVSWLPASGAQTASAKSPAFFATAADHLRRNDVVDTIPRPDRTWVGGGLPMLWQADSGFAYRSTGGSFLTSDPTHPILFATPVNLWESASFGLADGKPPPDDRYTDAARQQLLDTGVTVLLVVPQNGIDFTGIEQWAARVAGSAGTYEGGVWSYRMASASTSTSAPTVKKPTTTATSARQTATVAPPPFRVPQDLRLDVSPTAPI